MDEGEIIVPEVRKTLMIEKFLGEELNENFSDLDYDEIRAISFYRAIDGIIPLPNLMNLFEHHMSLKRSLDRKGRQEAVTIFKRPIQYIGHYPYPIEEDQPTKKVSWLGKIFRKRRPSEE